MVSKQECIHLKEIQSSHTQCRSKLLGTPVRSLVTGCSYSNKAQPGEIPKKAVTVPLWTLSRCLVVLCGHFLFCCLLLSIRIENWKFTEKNFESWISDWKMTVWVTLPHLHFPFKRKNKSGGGERRGYDVILRCWVLFQEVGASSRCFQSKGYLTSNEIFN